MQEYSFFFSLGKKPNYDLLYLITFIEKDISYCFIEYEMQVKDIPHSKHICYVKKS